MSEPKDEAPEAIGGCDVCKMNCTDPENLLGLKKYNFKYMCMPKLLPWCEKGGAPPPTLFSKDEKVPLMLSLLLGFQHALAMLGGIATSGGYLITNDTCLSWQKDSEMCDRMPWMISCAWLTSGILTIIQVFRLKIKGTPFYIGTGLISVMGTSFTFLPLARTMTLEAVIDAKASWPVCGTDSDGSPIWGGCCFPASPFDSSAPAPNADCKGSASGGYGKFLGTCLVGSLTEVFIAMLPPKYIKKLFPPVVVGSVVMLIGGSLISAGVKYLGGGVFCGENTESRATTKFGPARDSSSPQLCFSDNGEVVLSFGSSEYVGLGMSVILFSIIIQIFGSPFMKSTFLFWATALGCIVATCGYNDDGTWKTFFRHDFMDKAKPVTFLWAEGVYDIGFSVENFLPIIIAYVVSSAETIGDVGMTCVYSDVTDEAEIASRIQGGVLADGINSFFACLFGSPPNTTFSQNNGLIALTKCASRSAGFSCAFWLICLGIFGHFGAAFASIPICVIGGLVLQAFSAVFVSGMKMATQEFTRRNQFILMISLGMGLGVALEGHIVDWPGPYTFFRRNLAYDYGFWPEKYVCKTPNPKQINPADGLCRDGGDGSFSFNHNNGGCCSEYDESLKMLRKTVLMMLKTPYCLGFIMAFSLNLVLPEDSEEEGSQVSIQMTSTTSEA